MKSSGRLTAVLSLIMMFSIIIGAFVAHGLEDVLTPYDEDLMRTAQFYLTSGILGTFLLMQGGFLKPAKILMTGSLIFALSLYAIVFSGYKAFGAITPIGGVLMICAWGMTAFQAYRQR